MQFPFRFWFAFLWLCLITFSIFSCKQNKNPCNLPASVLTDIAKLDSLVNVTELRERDSLWNAGSYKETPVYSARHETYRFIWSGAFGDARVCRIEHNSASYNVRVKKFTKDGVIAESRYFNIS